MIIKRKKTRQIAIGNVKIGGDAPISVQSMTNTDTRDVTSTVAQIKRFEEAGLRPTDADRPRVNRIQSAGL